MDCNIIVGAGVRIFNIENIENFTLSMKYIVWFKFNENINTEFKHNKEIIYVYKHT